MFFKIVCLRHPTQRVYHVKAIIDIPRQNEQTSIIPYLRSCLNFGSNF